MHNLDKLSQIVQTISSPNDHIVTMDHVITYVSCDTSIVSAIDLHCSLVGSTPVGL